MNKFYIIALVACLICGIGGFAAGRYQGERIGEERIKEEAVKAGVEEIHCDISGVCTFDFKKTKKWF